MSRDRYSTARDLTAAEKARILIVAMTSWNAHGVHAWRPTSASPADVQLGDKGKAEEGDPRARLRARHEVLSPGVPPRVAVAEAERVHVDRVDHLAGLGDDDARRDAVEREGEEEVQRRHVGSPLPSEGQRQPGVALEVVEDGGDARVSDGRGLIIRERVVVFGARRFAESAAHGASGK